MKKIEYSIFAVCLALLSVAAFAAAGSAIYTINGTPLVVSTATRNFPITVTISPQSGVVGTVEYSTTPTAVTSPSTATWQVLGVASGVSSAQTVTVPSAITAIRFTRVSGASAVVGEIDWPY